jgi:hypothetical protein
LEAINDVAVDFAFSSILFLVVQKLQDRYRHGTIAEMGTAIQIVRCFVVKICNIHVEIALKIATDLRYVGGKMSLIFAHETKGSHVRFISGGEPQQRMHSHRLAHH